MKLDFGCGKLLEEGWEGVDYTPLPGIKYVVNLNKKKKLPFKSNSIDEARAFHLVEHLDDPMGFVNEVHRILKPGSVFTITVPYFAYGMSHVPIHKTYWNFRTHILFDGEYHEINAKWKVEMSWNWRVTEKSVKKHFILLPFFWVQKAIDKFLLKPYRRYELYELGICYIIPVESITFKLTKVV